jgi:hypothetical protein
MKQLVSAIGFGALLAAAHVANAQPESRAALAKHQLSECMSKRMSANKTVSFNEALRACKDRVQPPKDTLASNGPGETGVKSH